METEKPDVAEILKFADKIVHICKGNLSLNHNLLTDIMKWMLPA